MLFQATVPDTSSYLIGGYAFFFAVTILYLISLYIRWRNLERDLQALKELEE